MSKPTFDSTIELKNNAMLKIRPELFDEWDFDKNDELGLDVYKMTKGMHKNVGWICPKCDSDYDMQVNDRTNNRNCPYCRGLRVNHTNSLATINPKLASEWHPALNGDLTPNDVTVSGGKYIWWICENDHEWEDSLNHRGSSGRGCPYCSNKRLLIGFNDISTTNPELAKLFLNHEDGYRYTQWSNQKADFKCTDCKRISPRKTISDVNKKGLMCPVCSDGISYPEKVVGALLKQLEVEFNPEKTFEWSDKKRYDFYLPEYDCIIESHGEQHYRQISGIFGDKDLKQEQENDRYKEQLAIENGIKHYVKLDCRVSDLEYISKSVLLSELKCLLNLEIVDWQLIGKTAMKSKMIEACKTYERLKENLSFKEIAEEVGLSTSGLRTYVKRGHEAGICEYSHYK